MDVYFWNCPFLVRCSICGIFSCLTGWLRVCSIHGLQLESIPTPAASAARAYPCTGFDVSMIMDGSKKKTRKRKLFEMPEEASPCRKSQNRRESGNGLRLDDAISEVSSSPSPVSRQVSIETQPSADASPMLTSFSSPMPPPYSSMLNESLVRHSTCPVTKPQTNYTAWPSYMFGQSSANSTASTRWAVESMRASREDEATGLSTGVSLSTPRGQDVALAPTTRKTGLVDKEAWTAVQALLELKAVPAKL